MVPNQVPTSAPSLNSTAHDAVAPLFWATPLLLPLLLVLLLCCFCCCAGALLLRSREGGFTRMEEDAPGRKKHRLTVLTKENSTAALARRVIQRISFRDTDSSRTSEFQGQNPMAPSEPPASAGGLRPGATSSALV